MTRTLLPLVVLGSLLVALPARAQIAAAPSRSLSLGFGASRLARAPAVRWGSWGQTGTRTERPASPAPQLPPAQPGRVQCTVTAAGALSPAMIEVRQEGRVVASGACGEPIEVPGGDYSATITLERAIDRPQQTVPLHVPENGIGTATAAFDTSILEVRFVKGGLGTFGQAILERDGRQIGSIGSGVVAFVSSGRVTIRARHLTEWKTYSVDLAPGQRRAIYAMF